MNEKNDKIINIFKKSIFIKSGYNNKYNWRTKIIENKLNKSLIDNIFNNLSNSKNKLNKSECRIKNTKFKLKNYNKDIYKTIKFKNKFLKNTIHNIKMINIKVNLLSNFDNQSSPITREKVYIFYYKNNIYLFGGILYKVFYDIWKYDIIDNKWYNLLSKIEQLKQYNNLITIHYKNIIYFYGNKYIVKNNNSYYKLVKSNFNLKDFTFNEQIIENFKIIKNYSYNIFTENLIIKIGGIDQLDKINKNIFILCLHDNNFVKSKIKNNIFKNGIFKCKIVSYYNYNFKCVNHFLKCNKFKLEEGIYIFGGYDIDGIFYKELYHIIYDNRYQNFIINIINNKGIYPEPRIDHSMEYLNKNYCIIIFGGRSYLNNKYLLNNIHFYNIKTKTFYRTQLNESFKKFSNGSTINDNKIYIFGGINNNGYCNKNIIEIELKIIKNII